eukprot:scaffold946_cov415-Prasinococcus_capsulatus_cf.AAC.15
MTCAPAAGWRVRNMSVHIAYHQPRPSSPPPWSHHSKGDGASRAGRPGDAGTGWRAGQEASCRRCCPQGLLKGGDRPAGAAHARPAEQRARARLPRLG